MKVKFKIERTIEVSKEVCLWNTWDHEHLYFVHKQFNQAKILTENEKSVAIETHMKVPYLPIRLKGLHLLFELSERNVLVIDTLPFGVRVQLLMRYIENSEKQTTLINQYEIDLPWFLAPLSIILKKIIPRWNEVNWLEDMPLKLRRQKALDLGFRDYHGITKNPLENKKLRLPIKRIIGTHISQ